MRLAGIPPAHRAHPPDPRPCRRLGHPIMGDAVYGGGQRRIASAGAARSCSRSTPGSRHGAGSARIWLKTCGECGYEDLNSSRAIMSAIRRSRNGAWARCRAAIGERVTVMFENAGKVVMDTAAGARWTGWTSRHERLRETVSAAEIAAMIDPFGRAITYLRVSVTDRCDFRCVYCMAEDMAFLPKAELLTLEELERLCARLHPAGRDQAAPDRRRAAGAAGRDVAVRALGAAAGRTGWRS